MRLEAEEANLLLELVVRMRRDSIKHVFTATGPLGRASPLVFEGAQPLKGRFEDAYRELILVLEPFARTQKHFSTQPWAGSDDPVRIHESNAQLARESMRVSQRYAAFAEVTAAIFAELRRVLVE